MAERFSTQSLKQHGARRLTVEENNGFVNTFQDRDGTELFMNAANVALTDQTLRSGSLNVEQYFVAKSFFMKNGISETSSITMAMIALDAAKVLEKSVMKVLEPFEKDAGLIFEFETYAAMNFFRPSSEQHGYLVEKKNSNSLRSRVIKP